MSPQRTIETVWDEVHHDGMREQLMSDVIPRLSMRQRAEGIAEFAKGYTPGHKEGAIRPVIEFHLLHLEHRVPGGAL